MSLRDWWRGYSDADMQSLDLKLLQSAGSKPGSLTYLSPSEMAAFEATRRSKVQTFDWDGCSSSASPLN